MNAAEKQRALTIEQNLSKLSSLGILGLNKPFAAMDRRAIDPKANRKRSLDRMEETSRNSHEDYQPSEDEEGDEEVSSDNEEQDFDDLMDYKKQQALLCRSQVTMVKGTTMPPYTGSVVPDHHGSQSKRPHGSESHLSRGTVEPQQSSRTLLRRCTIHEESNVNPEMDDELEREVEVGMTDASGERKTRGLTRMSDIWNLPPGKCIVVTFNPAFQPVENEGMIYNRFLGTIARKPNLCPIGHNDWRKVAKECKEDCWNVVLSKFVIPQDEEARTTIKDLTLRSIGSKWKGWKCDLKGRHYDPTKTAAQIVATAPPTVELQQYAQLVGYWFTPAGQQISRDNKERRAAQKNAHTAGSKTFAQHAYDLNKKKNVKVTRANLYIPTHTRKDGTPVNKEAALKIQKINELQRNQPSTEEGDPNGGIAWREDDIYAQVHGKEKYGRIRGLGFGPTPSKHGGIISNTRVRMAFEEERVKDKEIIQTLQDQLLTQNAEVNTLKKQMAFLLSCIGSSDGFEIANSGDVAAIDEVMPEINQSSPTTGSDESNDQLV